MGYTEEDCCHLHIHDDSEIIEGLVPKRECLYRKHTWEKLTPARICPDDGTCAYAEDGGPFQEGEGSLCC